MRSRQTELQERALPELQERTRPLAGLSSASRETVPRALMELAEAIQQSLPLQILIPIPRRPLQTEPHLVAEMFVVDTSSGRAIVWLEPFWCGSPDLQVCRIAYASPRSVRGGRRWTDEQPRYGPRCLAYQKPFVIERVDQDSPVWAERKAWDDWRAAKGLKCDRDAAWRRVETELRDLNLRRLV